MKITDIRKRLEYLRKEIEAERISTEEIAELESLAFYIAPGDVQLLEWAGVPEKKYKLQESTVQRALGRKVSGTQGQFIHDDKENK